MKWTVGDAHADWLRLVEPEGQFLTLPVLHRAFPNGLDAISPSVREDLRRRYPKGARPTQEQWDAWTDWLLRDVLRWGPYYRTGDEASLYAEAVPEHGLVLRADGALVRDGVARVLVMRFPHGTVLDRRLVGDRWNTSPIDRLNVLCRARGVYLGIATDGERIVLVWFPSVGSGGYGTWDTSLFLESRERGLFQSFVSLLSASRFFAVQEDAQIEALFAASEKAQSEVTDQLGFQIRQAVELLVNAISRANLERGGKLLSGIAPHRVYEAAVTVMMRLVFLLYAEERDLLPLSEPLYADFYAASTLREQLDEQAALEGDEPLERRGAAWNRVLATFRVIFAGLNHDRLRLPPYGGRLFDPDRFPFLEGRTDEQKWNEAPSDPLPIDDLTVRAILEAIQTLPIRASGSNERRRLSFRSLDVEQIGHVYEGLLDHDAERVNDVYVGLVGKTGDEAELPLAEIEAAGKRGKGALITFLAEKTKRSESAIEKLLARGQELIQGKDQETRRLLNTACDNDAALAARLAPFVYSMRADLHGLPVVFKPGVLVVRQTRARRDSGTEYTPRELAEEMVRYALEPLVYSPGPRDDVKPEKWQLRASGDLLDLKICDPAVGSGAFLVATCRYLADRVVEAWIAEDPPRENDNRDELTLQARRAVVDRCLYGVDRDSMAVEMAKLSLWLVTLAREQSFSFLDHSIREGDSLLGIYSLDQVLYAHIDPAKGKALHEGSLFNVTKVIQPLVERAATLRRNLESLPNLTARDAEAKQRLNDEASSVLHVANLIADAIVATALSSGSREDSGKAAFQLLAVRIQGVLNPTASDEERHAAIEDLRRVNQQMLNRGRPDNSPLRVPLHWALVFPEVFQRRVGFDAIIGNPPFAGGSKITGSFGSDYRSYLVQNVAQGKKGNADLVCYFFLRAAKLSQTFSFLAVNTIAQGDTREVGLESLIADGWRVTRAIRTRRWPGAAGVHISQVWMAQESGQRQCILDNLPLRGISAFLTPERAIAGKPNRLGASRGTAFQGSYVHGLGFTMTVDEARRLIEKDDKNRDVLRPYLNAEDLCSRPDASPSRFVINFQDWPIERAQEYADCFGRVRELVLPERARNSDKKLRDIWWRFKRPVRQLYDLIGGFDRVVVMPLVSKVVVPLMYETNIVFAHKLAVVCSPESSMFGVLSSSVHREWAKRYGSTLGATTNYSISDCFETFPFPPLKRGTADAIDAIDCKRRSIMSKSNIGLTTLYNRINDESDSDLEINRLRDLLETLDREVCEAYGWTDLHLSCDFVATEGGICWTVSEHTRDKILDRLLEMNQERYEAEMARAKSNDVDTSGRGMTKKRKRSSGIVKKPQLSLYS